MPQFLVEHRHDISDCQAIRKVIVSWAESPPGPLQQIYWEPGAHRGWFVMEAESHLGVHDVIGSIVEMSTNVIHAVLSRDDIVEVDREADGRPPG